MADRHVLILVGKNAGKRGVVVHLLDDQVLVKIGKDTLYYKKSEVEFL